LPRRLGFEIPSNNYSRVSRPRSWTLSDFEKKTPISLDGCFVKSTGHREQKCVPRTYRSFKRYIVIQVTAVRRHGFADDKSSFVAFTKTLPNSRVDEMFAAGILTRKSDEFRISTTAYAVFRRNVKLTQKTIRSGGRLIIHSRRFDFNFPKL